MLKVTFSVPSEAAEKLLQRWRDRDPELLAAFGEVGITDVRPATENELSPQSDAILREILGRTYFTIQEIILAVSKSEGVAATHEIYETVERLVDAGQVVKVIAAVGLSQNDVYRVRRLA